jgi:hypothetical protein
MECWMVPSIWMYSCEPFNTEEHPERFLTIMVVFASMNDQEWGRSDFIKEDSEGTYVCVEDEKEQSAGKKDVPPDNFKSLTSQFYNGRLTSIEIGGVVAAHAYKLEELLL